MTSECECPVCLTVTLMVCVRFSEVSADHRWTASVQKKCSSACQPRAAAVPCKLLPQVMAVLMVKDELLVATMTVDNSRLTFPLWKCHTVPEVQPVGSQWGGGGSVWGCVAGIQLELLEGPEESLRCSYKYMFQRLQDVRKGDLLSHSLSQTFWFWM